VDVVEWGPELHMLVGRGTFERREGLENKGLQCSSKNMSEENKESICLSKARESKKERGAQAYCSCAECVMGCVESSMELIFIVVKCDCWSLFVGAIVAFVDNSRLVDNSGELIDNVRDKHLLIYKK